MAGGRPWTGAETVRFKRMWEEDVPVARIMQHFDRSEDAISAYRRHLKLPPRNSRRRNLVVPLEDDLLLRLTAVASHRNVTAAEMVRSMIAVRLAQPLVKR